ncbi:MAG: N-acetyl-gamma-glutamyl-phosphate reductase [Chloroflexi bacterium ADurb.Bin325]|nr:MAG: N-acetyl-gamma-glutamyl-phosphate reductase [Chloroflexi bacterium ADurb.Bin325]
MLKIGIIGATGYTGLELLRLLQRHPAAEIAWLTSENSAGQRFGAAFAVPPPIGEHTLVKLADADLAAADVVFCCLPHAASQAPVAAARAAGARVIDLSADYRLHDPAVYEAWYNHPHEQTALLAEAVYGLPELYRPEIARAALVANPGCYPTSVILGLAPLARCGWLAGTIIADSKSGVSGAGRTPTLKTHFVEASENFSPYNIGRVHRHLVEMEQELRLAEGAAQNGWQLIFSPHLLPVNRGILSTIYVNLPAGVTEAQVREQYADAYRAEPFVNLLPAGQVATLAHTVHTNYIAIALTFVPNTQTLIVTASIDNLVKGASGQAIQNLNIMHGLDERMGLL